jgi:hypothetical protein
MFSQIPTTPAAIGAAASNASTTVNGQTCTLGSTCTVTATGAGAVVASIPSTAYTAPISCTTFYTPSAAGMYRISSDITTTVAGSGTGTMQASIAYTQPDGQNRGPTMCGTINLALVGSDSANGCASAEYIFRAKASTNIQYCAAMTGSTTGYTYSGAWYLEYLGP